MILYPAIDLKDGNCVRLLRGEMSNATVFNDDPAGQAKCFQDAGCEWLHLVDLNGAFQGASANSEAISAILEAIDIPCQLGGGIRELKDIEHWLSRGIARVIIGTAAVETPTIVRKAAQLFPGQVAVGLDTRGSTVATHGWAKETGMSTIDLAQSYEDAGICAIIYTDINRDGAMEGPNTLATQNLAQSVSIPIIASGGVSCMADLIDLHETGVIAGAVSGRALYEGTFNLAQAIKDLSA